MGGITGAMIGMGMPEFEAKHYAVKVKEGLILILNPHDQSGPYKDRKGGAERGQGFELRGGWSWNDPELRVFGEPVRPDRGVVTVKNANRDIEHGPT